MWDLPLLGLEPVCPALAAGFLTTVLPGKSFFCILKYDNMLWLSLGCFLFLINWVHSEFCSDRMVVFIYVHRSVVNIAIVEESGSSLASTKTRWDQIGRAHV